MARRLNNTPDRLCSLSFEATCQLVERFRDPMRWRVGALEVVSGYLDGDDETERATIVIDPATGSSYVSEWVAA
jgi:hypothetical protein